MFYNATFGTTVCSVFLCFLPPPSLSSKLQYVWLVHASAANPSQKHVLFAEKASVSQKLSHFSLNFRRTVYLSGPAQGSLRSRAGIEVIAKNVHMEHLG
jgi:hypothetical protein